MHHLLVLGRQTHLNSKHHSAFLPKRDRGASASVSLGPWQRRSAEAAGDFVCLCRRLQHHQEEATWPLPEPPMQESLALSRCHKGRCVCVCVWVCMCVYVLSRCHKDVSGCVYCLVVSRYACQAPLSMEFSRQKYWTWLSFPYQGNLPNPGIKPGSPALQADSLLSEPSGKPTTRIPLIHLDFPTM